MTEIIADDVSVDIDMSYSGWEATEIEAITSRYNETDIVKATVVDPDFSEEPTIRDYASLDIDGRRVFTGNVYDASEVEKKSRDSTGKFKVKLMNDLHKAKNTELSLSVTEPTPLSEVVQQVCSEAGVVCTTDLTWRPDDPSQTASDWTIGPDFSDKTAAEALDKLAEWANADWFVNNYNVIEFGLPDAEIKTVEYIKSESEFGPVEPPYRGVRVVPNGAISELSNSQAYGLIGYAPTSPKRALDFNEETGVWEIDDFYTNDPTYVHNDEQVKTYETAEAVAEKFARELLRQVDGGKIVIVGDATIDERDVIELPDFLQNRQYFVGEIKHKINDSDGFVTELNLESAVPGDGV